MEFPLKIITIAIKNTKTIINLMKHEKIRQKIVNKEKRKEMKTQKVNKRQKNQKMGINIKALNQNQ